MHPGKLVVSVLALSSLQLIGCVVRPARVVYVEAAPQPAPVAVVQEEAVPTEEVDEEVTPATEVPPPQVENPGPAPSTTVIWIGGRWTWVGGAWVWRHGHWAQRQANRSWVPGHWERHHHHWVWRHGYWR